ncbi:MAG: hypothetical protein NTU53_15990 [Planctomycetota bacterium]|nr:hypothetical protein [Planctomycetota bacterium]
MKLGGYILAADEIDGIFKLLIGIVVGAIWLIGAVMAAKKKKPGGEKEKSWEQILRDLTGGQSEAEVKQQMPPPLPPAMPKVTKPVVKRAVVRKGGKRVPAPPFTPPKVLPPVLVGSGVMEHAAGGDAYVRGDIEASEIGSAGAASKRRADEATVGLLRQWLKPGSLRRQWILTEILGPPVALRE